MGRAKGRSGNLVGPRVVDRRCANCDYFVREVSGGPACALKNRPTKETATCGGWQARQACRVCGCSHHDPCPEGCWWVEPDLCSACVLEEGVTEIHAALKAAGKRLPS